MENKNNKIGNGPKNRNNKRNNNRYINCTIQQLPQATQAIQNIYNYGAVPKMVEGGIENPQFPIADAPQTATVTGEETVALSPEYDTHPYCRLRGLYYNNISGFLYAVKMLKMSQDIELLIKIVVDHIMPETKTDEAYILRETFLSDIVTIAAIDKGSSISNLRSRFSAYLSDKKRPRKAV